MTYKIIEIRDTRQGEVAYVLDVEGGRVLRMPVEDFERPRRVQVRQYEDEPEDYPTRRRRVPVPAPAEPMEDVTPPRPKVSAMQAQSIIPPQFRGIFTPEGEPGADVEKRIV